MILLFAVRHDAAALFGASDTVQREVAEILPYFIAGFLFLAFVRVTTSGFYATEKNNFAYILVYAEPVMLFLLPPGRSKILGHHRHLDCCAPVSDDHGRDRTSRKKNMMLRNLP